MFRQTTIQNGTSFANYKVSVPGLYGVEMAERIVGTLKFIDGKIYMEMPSNILVPETTSGGGGGGVIDPPVGDLTFYESTPMFLGRLSTEEGAVNDGRWIRYTGGVQTRIAGSWDLRAKTTNPFVPSVTYNLRGVVRVRNTSDGSLYTGTSKYQIRNSDSPQMDTNLGNIVTGVTDTITFTTGESVLDTTFIYDPAKPYLGILGQDLAAGTRLEFIVTDDTEAEPIVLPWSVIPVKSARTISIAGVPQTVNTTAIDPIYIPPGATQAHIRVTFNGTYEGEVTCTSNLNVAVTSVSGGFAFGDIVAPAYDYWWRPGDDADIWVTLDIPNPKTTAGAKFKVNLGGGGLAGAFATWVEVKENVVNALPVSLPFHRARKTIDLVAATPDNVLDIENIIMTDSGYYIPGDPPTLTGVGRNTVGAQPCWLNRLPHGYSYLSSNGQNSIYVNPEVVDRGEITGIPDGYEESVAIETDSNDRPYLRLKAQKLPTPATYFDKPFPFTGAALSTLRMPDWCHKTGVWDFWGVWPSQPGVWHAGWVFGVSEAGTPPIMSGRWPPEYDIDEQFNGVFNETWGPDTTSSTQHVGFHGSDKREHIVGMGQQLKKGGFATDHDFFTQIHRITFVRDATHVTTYVDGVEVYQALDMLNDPLDDPADPWELHTIFNVGVKLLADNPFSEGTTDRLIYGYQHFPLNSGYTITDFAEEAPFDNRQITPGPDILVRLPSVSLSVTSTLAGTPVSEGQVTFTDTFTRSDENLEASTNWERVDGVANQLLVRSNALASTTTSSTNQTTYLIASSFALTTDQYAEVTWSSGVNQTGWVLCRATDSNNFVGVQKLNGSYMVYKRVAGTFTQLGSGGVHVAGETVQLQVVGQTIKLFVNGAQKFTASLGVGELTTGRPGLMSRTTGANPWIDNFKVGVP